MILLNIACLVGGIRKANLPRHSDVHSIGNKDKPESAISA